MSHTISNERLQHIVQTFNEADSKADASEKLGLALETLNRYMREARERDIEYIIHKPPVKMPKILLLDIETSLMRFYAWSCGKTYLGPSQIETDWHMLGWAVKWLFETEIYSDIITPEEAAEHTDKRITESLWGFLDEADIVIAHNALGFDIPKIMGRIINHQLLPPSPYQVIDTLQASRSIARFSSNKQDELAKLFGLRRKVEHEGYNLWVRCFNADTEALTTMNEYNKGDTTGLEDLYLYLRPYIKSHPNLALYMENEHDSCYKCGSENIKWLYDDSGEPKYYYTNVNRYPAYRCNDCNSPGRSRNSAMSKDQRKVITSPIAR